VHRSNGTHLTNNLDGLGMSASYRRKAGSQDKGHSRNDGGIRENMSAHHEAIEAIQGKT
jgi:hypothetical protein